MELLIKKEKNVYPKWKNLVHENNKGQSSKINVKPTSINGAVNGNSQP